MDEYIKREAVIDLITRRYENPEICTQEINSIPAADVAPVVRGRWEIVVGSNGKEHMVCTRCRVSQDLTGVFTYCPNCGAKMDGGDSDEVD